MGAMGGCSGLLRTVIMGWQMGGWKVNSGACRGVKERRECYRQTDYIKADKKCG